MSFERAVKDLGWDLTIFHPEVSSLSKNESFQDTVQAMCQIVQPDIFVIRHKDNVCNTVQEMASCVVISAGTGKESHPTQALTDAYTIWEEYKTFESKTILIIGDVENSRVAASNFNLWNDLPVRVIACCPEDQKANLPPFVEWIRNPSQAIKDADVVMTLRVQKLNKSNLFEWLPYQVNAKLLNNAKKDPIIMHPGPANLGVEITKSVACSPRSRILNQIENGVIVRRNLLQLYG